MSAAAAITLENEAIRLRVLSTGAEICEFTHKSTGIDHIWGADPNVWVSHAPVLFPAVGRLFDDMFREGEKSYPHPKHGIVRRSQLSVVHQTASEVWLSLVANVETRRAYPFEFELRIGFVLEGNRVSQRFEVYNKGDISMPFAIGGHPGFSIPMTAQTDIDDYYLEFEKNEQSERYVITADGYFSGETVPVRWRDGSIIDITKALFAKDALVFKDLKSRKVTLRSAKHSHSVTLTFERFPYLGVWAKPAAQFVCIEPWIGCADDTDKPIPFREKVGIIELAPGKSFKASFGMEVR